MIEVLDKAGDDVDLDALYDDGCTALSIASFRDNLEMVELLLARGAKPDVKGKKYPGHDYYLTPLHIVCEDKGRFNPEVAQLLIRFGASVDALDSRRQTPLHLAVDASNAEMVEILLRQGADPLSPDPLMEEDSSPLFFRVIKKYAQDNGTVFRLIWRWITERKKITFPVDSKGNTVLHIAARNGAAGTVGALYTMLRACVCQTGLSASVLNSYLQSPLVEAISFHNLDAARFILLYGGQPVAHSNFEATSPLLRAFKMMLLGEGLRPDIRQEQCHQLCQLIVDSGYPLGGEKWLNNNFDVEFLLETVVLRSFVGESPSDNWIDAARLLFESLKEQRRRPLSLKSLARLAIRRSVMENPCLRCKLDAFEKTSLEGLMGSLNLPPKLRSFVTYLDLRV